MRKKEVGAATKIFTALGIGFLWIIWLFSNLTNDGISNEYYREGCFILGVGVAFPFAAIPIGWEKSSTIDIILAVVFLYLLIGLVANFYISKKHGSGFLPSSIPPVEE